MKWTPKRILTNLNLIHWKKDTDISKMHRSAAYALRKQSEFHWLTKTEEEVLRNFIAGTEYETQTTPRKPSFRDQVESLYQEMTTTANIEVIPMPFAKANEEEDDEEE